MRSLAQQISACSTACRKNFSMCSHYVVFICTYSIKFYFYGIKLYKYDYYTNIFDNFYLNTHFIFFDLQFLSTGIMFVFSKLIDLIDTVSKTIILPHPSKNWGKNRSSIAWTVVRTYTVISWDKEIWLRAKKVWFE